MSVAFATRNPTKAEVEHLRLVLSTFRDGSGMLAVGNETFPGWRDFERAVAAVLHGNAPEKKGVFDVTISSTSAGDIDYGLSIKSKKLSAKDGITNLATHGRVYMELANSPAKFLKALKKIAISEPDFTAKRRPQDVGEVVLRTVGEWHDESVAIHKKNYHRTLDLSRSRYLVLSYRLPTKKSSKHYYQWHSFELAFPQNIVWKYATEKCLRGYDPQFPTEALFDLYLRSGGQLKYYPRASTAKFFPPVFELSEPAALPMLLRAARMFPTAWIAAGAAPNLSVPQIDLELSSMAQLTSNPKVRAILDRASEEVRQLNP